MEERSENEVSAQTNKQTGGVALKSFCFRIPYALPLEKTKKKREGRVAEELPCV